MVKGEKARPNFYRMFSQNLPISAAFTAILKIKLPQCKAIGVCTPPVATVLRATALFSGPVVSALGSESDDLGSSPGRGEARRCALETCGKKNANSAFRLG